MKNSFKITLAVGALFLSACSPKGVTVEVTNPLGMAVQHQIVGVPWSTVVAKLVVGEGEQIVAISAAGDTLPTQLVYQGSETPQQLIFSATLTAGEAARYQLSVIRREPFALQAQTRFVPERKDDISWENDRIAFRMYGPALEATGEISNGIDIWLKRTPEMISKKWYDDDLAGVQSYHEDHGEGLDCYKVGRTLGAGAMAPYVDDSLYLANNFVSYKILDNGPLRTTFELEYAPFDVAGNSISETRTITLDAGSQFNKIEERYTTSKPMQVAAGIVTRPGNMNANFDVKLGYIAYVEPTQPEIGVTYVGLVFDAPIQDAKIAPEHLLAVTTYQPDTVLTYYAGGGWSKWGFPTEEEWITYVTRFAEQVRAPLQVVVK